MGNCPFKERHIEQLPEDTPGSLRYLKELLGEALKDL
jgi:hypothetical protein